MAVQSNNKCMELLKSILDDVLQDIVWVNAQSQVVNLKQVLSEKSPNSAVPCIEKLNNEDLYGAFTCLQIKNEMYDESVEGKSSEELSKMIKDLIFAEANARLVNMGMYETENVETNQQKVA